MTYARGKTNTPVPIQPNGALIREKATCSRCKAPCLVGGQVQVANAYYKYNDEKLCKSCIRLTGVL